MDMKRSFEDIRECKNILVLAPHPDDEIFGAGGLLYKFTKEDDRKIHVIYLTCGDKGTPDAPASKEVAIIREHESANVMERLNIMNYEYCHLPDGELDCHLIEIKNIVIEKIKDFQPDLILFTHLGEQHPDHHALADAMVELCNDFKDIYFLGYEVWYDIDDVNIYVGLTKEEFDKKLELGDLYESQQKLFDYRTGISKTMKKRGKEIGKEYAEAYILYR